MQAIITQKLIQSLKPKSVPYEVRDKSVKGFLVRKQPSGVASYVVQYKRGKRITLGKLGIVTPGQARVKAKMVIGMAADGASDFEIRDAVRSKDGDTLETFIRDHYEPWAITNLKTGAEIVARIRATFFADLGHRQLGDISPWLIEKWRKRRKENGKMIATINRDLTCLKSSLNKAVEWDKLEENPIAKVKPDKVDSKPKVRFLTDDEETRLRAALVNRDEKLKEGRESGNAWRDERNYDQLPALSGQFAGHFSPMILLSLNTGMRRGEVFSLKWPDIDFKKQFLTVVGGVAKSGRTRHIPLNDEALYTLKEWRKQTEGNDYVFAGKNGGRLNNVNKAWGKLLKDAKITNFRWHDMRHHFASKLVMAGVSVYVVKELLGHSSIETTERYSHLAPGHMAEAVACLVPPDSKNYLEQIK